jgi:hypothetical protein
MLKVNQYTTPQLKMANKTLQTLQLVHPQLFYTIVIAKATDHCRTLVFINCLNLSRACSNLFK